MSSFPIAEIRQDFPALVIPNCSQTAIYLDNPAGTQLPQRVTSAVCDAMISASSNLGGFFQSSQNADSILTNAHQAMADMLGAASAREIIIGPNMTTLTLHLSRSIARTMSPGDEIIVTRMDHEGDVSLWLLMAEDCGSLSPREQEVAQYILKGHSSISIGAHPGISVTTVKTHR